MVMCMPWSVDLATTPLLLTLTLIPMLLTPDLMLVVLQHRNVELDVGREGLGESRKCGRPPCGSIALQEAKHR
eukprot:751224-Hanusia_phi.AAC.1